MDCLAVKSAFVDKIRKGYPWVYTNALVSPKDLESGTLVYLGDTKRKPFAIAYYNPNSKIACRVLTLDWKTTIDSHFFYGLFQKALAKRESRFSVPYYRLVHAEGDGLPGLIIDRYADILVCQVGTAGMENLKSLWLPPLEDLLKPKQIIFKQDLTHRQKEGLNNLPCEQTSCEPLQVIEHDTLFFASPIDGQKTGWFYDQRANRHWMAGFCKDKTVLDLYTYSGGFGISAAKKGAKHVTLVDSSKTALTLAQQGATANAVSDKCEFIHENVFNVLAQLEEQNQQFDVVIADPPAFVKHSQHKGAGLRGYQKLAKLCATRVFPQGLLFIASCSHHAPTDEFRKAVEAGITKAGRQFTFIRKGGADKDHPIHPLLPENHYLKALLYQLD
ncbi:MAG: class I SAM-dependent rRNA methyltransferase [Proteobacteria bacterium]|nr:class I SAM-dependent rRNA methyltransferase [Pseudomonadota bacterium]